MFRFSTGPRDRTLGLDIGSTAIKLVELKPKPGGFEITQFAHRLIPPEAQERDDQIAGLIRRMFEEQGLKRRGVYVAVSGQNVVIRRSALPKMPLGELVEAIKWDMREEIIFPLEGAAVDYHITGETVQGGATFFELLAVVAENSVIQRHVGLVQSAGLNLLGITAFPIALWDYDRTLEAIQTGEVVCFIDMGAERTRVYFASDNDLLFFREIPTGGQNVTEALMEPFELPDGGRLVLEEERAEQIKKEYGFPAEEAPGSTGEGIPLAELHERMLPMLNKQAEEIYRSVEYFQNLFKREDITRINVSGGAGGLKGFYKFLSQMLELKIAQFNPLLQSSPPVAGISEEEAQILGPSLAAAAGLALGRCDKINLLPDEFRPSLRKNLIRLAQAAVIPLVLAGFAFYGMHLRGQAADLESALQAQRQELAQLKQVIASLDAPKQQLAALEVERQKLLGQIGQMPVGVENPVDIPHFLEELTRTLPENVSLQQMTYTEEDAAADEQLGLRFVLNGNVFGDESSVVSTVNEFVDNLSRAPSVTAVKLLNSQRMSGEMFTQSGLTFTLAVHVSNETDIPL